jgi:Spy/CpxP family protein refolding chaperone
MNQQIILSLILAASMTLPIVAQPRGRMGMGGPGGLQQGGLGFMAGYLNLTEAQKTQAKAIFDANASGMEQLRGEMQSAREALEAGIKANKTDAELDQLASAIGAVTTRMTSLQARQQKAFRAILTAEQLEKLDSRERRGQRK